MDPEPPHEREITFSQWAERHKRAARDIDSIRFPEEEKSQTPKVKSLGEKIRDYATNILLGLVVWIISLLLAPHVLAIMP